MLDSLSRYDLVVVDGELTKPATVARLHQAGAIVLGYLSVGTIEPFRSWYPKLKPYRLRDRFKQFGEIYADVDARGFRRIVAGRIAPRMLRSGFDGLFLDNTDMVETHKRERPGMRRLVRALSALVHARGGLLFAQNGDTSIGPLLRFYDGWNREDVTWTYSFKRRSYVHQPAREVAGAQAALRRIAGSRAPGDGDRLHGGRRRIGCAGGRGKCLRRRSSAIRQRHRAHQAPGRADRVRVALSGA